MKLLLIFKIICDLFKCHSHLRSKATSLHLPNKGPFSLLFRWFMDPGKYLQGKTVSPGKDFSGWCMLSQIRQELHEQHVFPLALHKPCESPPAVPARRPWGGEGWSDGGTVTGVPVGGAGAPPATTSASSRWEGRNNVLPRNHRVRYERTQFLKTQGLADWD